MAVGYRSSSRTGQSDAFVTSVNVPVPSGAAVDDIALVALEQWESSNPSVTAPAGFTLLTSVVSGSQKIRVWWKRLTAGDTGSYAFSWSGSQWTQGQAILLTGAVTSGDPIGTNFNTASASGTSVPSTSVTVGFIPGLVHFIANENTASKAPPTNHTEVQDADYLETNYRLPGSSGTFSATGGTTSASTLILAVLVAVEPAGSGSAVALDGTSSAAAQATGAASVDRTVAGASGSAAALTGQTSIVRPLAASSSAAASPAGALSVARPVTGSAGVAAQGSGTLVAARSVAGSVGAAAELAGDLTISGQVSLAGDVNAAAEAEGSAAVARPIAATASAAAQAVGSLDRASGLLGAASGTADTVGAVAVARPLVAAATACMELSGTLTSVRSLAGQSTAAAEVSGELNTTPLITRGASLLLARSAPSALPGGRGAATGSLLDRTVPTSRGDT